QTTGETMRLNALARIRVVRTLTALREDTQQFLYVRGFAGFVERYSDVRIVDSTKIHASRVGGFDQAPGGWPGEHGKRVEIRVIDSFPSHRGQAAGQGDRQIVNALCNFSDAPGPVVNSVHRCHDGQEGLRRTYVRGGFF